MAEYSTYRSTSFEWAKEIPNEWRLIKLKWISEIYAGGTPSKNIERYWENGTIPWINSGAVNQVVIQQPSEYITEEAFENSSAKWIPKNSIVMALAGQGKTKGMSAILDIETTCNQSMAAIVPINSISYSKFLFYWLNSNYNRIRGLAGDSQRDGLNLQIIGDIYCTVPSLPEQKQIARFLDHQTGLIDAVIAKKETLIKKLKEQRQATINEAVTKGLNPNAPLKDSGIPWLGEIPEHWEVKKLKHLKSKKANAFVDGPFGSNLKSVHFVENGDAYVIESGFITSGEFVFNKKFKSITADHFDTISRSSCEEGDIIIAKIGANYGTSGILPKLDKPAVVSGNSLKLTVNQSMVNLNFIRSALLFLKESGSFELIVNESAQPALSLGALNNISIAVPPLPEQESIWEHIKRSNYKSNETINKLENQINKLREYRQSLISEAVTGKIHVRDWEPEN